MIEGDKPSEPAVPEPTEPPVVAFQIFHSRYLDPAGVAVRPLPAFAQEPERLEALYRAMVLTRTFDARAVALQRTGQLGTFASSLGQEAVSVGIGDAMRPDDVLLPSFREQGAQFRRGVTMLELLQYWGGDERGSDFAGAGEDFPIAIPVGSHAPHAVGVALAFKLRGERRAAVCVFGDGATSRGDVYEAMNLAGVWRLPVVFVINNNQWAISVPRGRQTAAETLAQKAIAAGIPGEQVDGNDVVAVSQAVRLALENARAGNGASLIEALTYRLSDHTTADDATRYRDEQSVSDAWSREPIGRLRKHLVAQDRWTKQAEEMAIADSAAAVEAAVADYLAQTPQAPESMFDWLHEALPPALRPQRDALIADAAEAQDG